jgi:gamma-glutamyltranspeptidase / glutathione hydrolase
MKGAIAAGHPLTAEAGAQVLRAGGNAVDACVGAAFTSWVAESPLTGPGGGGFMLVHRARDDRSRLFDFFTAVPGAGLPEHERAEMEVVDVDFSGGSQQAFRIGAASVAVPGTALGLEEAHRSFGSLPWAELARPAIRLAREGLEMTREQAYLHAILDLILRHTEEGRAMYDGPGGSRLVAGDRFAYPDLAGTLEVIAERGAGELYRGELARRIVEHVRAGGGELTEEDLASYRVVRRRPVEVEYSGHTYASNPPPSSGGILIGWGLRLLDQLPSGPPGSAEAIASLGGVMREQARARADKIERHLYRGGLWERLHARERDALEAIGAWAPASPVSGTTHISVVDADGNAAALTNSTGSGSGVVVPGTGIHLSNMIGEFDLPRVPKPGVRLSSMQSPSIVKRDGAVRLVVGSAGSLRLRGAVMQIVVNVVGHGLGVEDAIERPRVHWEDPALHCEGGNDEAVMDALEAAGWPLVRWKRRNLYFGGAAAVEVRGDGTLHAAGDPRRGGHGIVVS